MTCVPPLPAPASPPRNIEVIPRSSTSLEVTWDSPPFSHWNSELLSFKIGYKCAIYYASTQLVMGGGD